MKIAFIRWRDAHTYQDDVPIKDLGEEPCELLEVGWLIKQTADHVVIGTERQRGMTSARFTLTIPKVNIVEMRVVDHAGAFPKASTRNVHISRT